MNLEKKTSTVATLALLDLLVDHGISCEEITRRTGIDGNMIGKPDISISLSEMIRLWDFSIEVSNDPTLGLHLRDQYGQNYRHFVVSITMNSRTLYDAARLWSRYARVICESDQITLVEGGDYCELVYSNLAPEFKCRSMIEHDIAQCVKYARLLSENVLDPVEVHFEYKRPDYASAYERLFNCPVYFESAENSILFRAKDLQQPIKSRDPHLQTVLKKHADSVLAQLSKEASVKSRIQTFIAENLVMGSLSIESAAASLNMSRSTLHRKLRKEETTFSELLENTRKASALTYMRQDMTSGQIAFLLGFSDASAFQHAFRRWYGKCPGEFRMGCHSSHRQ